ncbi:cysteine desulfurase [Aurantimicrobium minutum]|uniref:cysteine desulfurase family protein n=1 Tax=Aurantimicrobium minutum TaxID=708131 RepID=UPI0024738D6A|nr:cysteine desulfurase family protein [Aurantimicrobium minutum]MDH6424477.1 cysteine desulfurase [Aurantimicrobium minutum]
MVAYLDHAASTPVRPEAAKAFTDALAHAGNPSSVHRHGQAARALVEDAREYLATVLGSQPIEVIFTSGGTESINLALVGLFRAAVEKDAKRNRIVVPEAEHHATLDTVLWLQEHEGAVLEWIPVDKLGRIDVTEFSDTLERAGKSVALVTMLWANNEVGTIQPVAEIAALAAEHHVPLHIDAVSAFGHIPVNFAQIRTDSGAQGNAGLVALSISGHKFGSVPGVGALVVSREAQLEPLIHGGGQQRGLRSGTLDAPAISSMAIAALVTDKAFENEHARLISLRDATIAKIQELVPDAVLSGDLDNRLDNNVNFTFPGCQSDSLLFLLDAMGVSVSTGSACQAGVAQPSHVLLAMGHDERGASSALRISLGHTTAQEELDEFFSALPEAVERARKAGTTV